MRIFLPAALVCLSIVMPAQNPEWAITFSSPLHDDFFRELEVDTAGNTYVMYTAEDFSIPATRSFVSSYDTYGILRWTLQTDQHACMEIGRNGEVYLGGSVVLLNGESKFMLTKFDAAGNFMHRDTLSDPAPLWSGTVGKMILTGDNELVLAGYTANLDSVPVMKCDTAGNLLWVRHMSEPGALDHYLGALTCDGNNNVYVTIDAHDSVSTSTQVVKFMSNGNVSWERNITRPLILKFAGVYNDSTIFVAGEIYNQLAGVRDMFVMMMDSSGNTLWDTSINAGDYFNVAINRMDIVNDALITAAGTIVLTGWYTNGSLSPRWIDLGIDLQGTVQWVWENPSGAAHGYSAAEKPGDQVVTAGRVMTAQGVATGITVFDSIGAVVWSALYSTPQTVNVYEQQVGTDHLGNVYCAARYNDTLQSSVFLIKYSFLASVTDSTGSGSFVSVFPNPASGQLTIQAYMPGDELNFALTDVNGKIIFSSSVTNSSGIVQMQMDVSGLAAGIYFIRVSGEGMMQTKELVIAR